MALIWTAKFRCSIGVDFLEHLVDFPFPYEFVREFE